MIGGERNLILIDFKGSRGDKWGSGGEYIHISSLFFNHWSLNLGQVMPHYLQQDPVLHQG